MTVVCNFSYTVHELLPLGCTEKMLHQATKVQHNFRKMGRATYPTMSKSHIFSVVTKKDNLALHLRKNGQMQGLCRVLLQAICFDATRVKLSLQDNFLPSVTAYIKKFSVVNMV